MDPRWRSRKLLVTLLVVLVVAGSDLMGHGLSENTLDAVLKMALGLDGAQGLGDTASAGKAGQGVADAAEDVAGARDE